VPSYRVGVSPAVYTLGSTRRRFVVGLPARRAQTRQGAPALIRTMQNPKNARAPKSGPLMAIMALLLPGGTSQGLGGGFRRGQRVLRARLAVRYFPRRFGASCPDR